MRFEIEKRNPNVELIPLENVELYIGNINRLCLHVFHWKDKYPEVMYGSGRNQDGSEYKTVSFWRFDKDNKEIEATVTIVLYDIPKDIPLDHPIYVDLKYETQVMWLGWDDFYPYGTGKKNTGDSTKE